MAKVQKSAETNRIPFRRLSDSEILLFVTRTLQTGDADTADVFAKLQSLKGVLGQQEFMLSDWPDSPNKDRMRNALANAKNLVAQIANDLAGAARAGSTVDDVKSA
jgi:hypothetical protein